MSSVLSEDLNSANFRLYVVIVLILQCVITTSAPVCHTVTGYCSVSQCDQILRCVTTSVTKSDKILQCVTTIVTQSDQPLQAALGPPGLTVTLLSSLRVTDRASAGSAADTPSPPPSPPGLTGE